MKRSTLITILSLLIPLLGMSQTKAAYVDDIYLKPGDAKAQMSVQNQDTKEKTPQYKNGAKEIVYIERDSPNNKVVHDTVYVVGQANEVRQNTSSNVINGIVHDTIYVVGQANDSTENNREQGYYLNGFKGTESDMEYAERIRRFHNPRYEIFIADPRYNDIYFLNDYDWNVYVDGSYAYVTPTWTNPAWWNYNFSPYSYGGYGWYSPWGYNNFYGGFGFGGYFGDYFGYGGYYGYGYPYYGYGYGYGNWGYGYDGYWGGGKRHEDADQRLRNGISSREGGYGYNSSRTVASSRETSNPYTVIRGSNASRTKNLNTTSSRPVPNGIGSIRSQFSSRSLNRGLTGSSYTTTTRSSIPTINTRPRTTNYNSNNISNYSSRSVNSNSSPSPVRSTITSRSTYSTGNNSSYYRSNNSVSSRSSSSSYSSGSSGSSGGSYSGGGSSSGSRSSGGGGGRR
ncbi:MAG: hypothetical protein Q8904_12180 [Bacteroidota bacterium]|nr:hypothetical protein [Bacteroidota bacterium]